MSAGPGWLLLIHSIPPKPSYLRAKVMRRLTQLGALPLKRSAYLLPAGETALEDFQWLRREIQNDGGDAWVVEARFAGGPADAEIRDQFRELRGADYRAIAADARALLERTPPNGLTADESIEADRRRLAKRFETTRAVDFFGADGRDEVEALMSKLQHLTDGPQDAPARPPKREELQRRTWVTRRGVKVDRMASAWLIRRFIDASATFVFVDSKTESPPPAALRFDMFEGEFTHEGNRCTFEVLLDVVDRKDDRGLSLIGQIVHDLDLRDDRYQRPETAGIGAFIAGIVARFDDDHRRLAESTPFFDTLYTSFGGRGLRPSAGEK